MGRGDPEKEVVASRADPLGMLHWSLRRGHRSFFQGHRGGGGGILACLPVLGCAGSLPEW